MRDLNEDLDDQFREAVGRYRLRPVESQWNDLSGKIISMKRPSSIADPIRSKYRRWAKGLALLMLIAVAFVFVKPGFHGLDKAPAKKNGVADQKNSTEKVHQKINPSKKSDSQISDPVSVSSQALNSSTAKSQTMTSVQLQSVIPGAAQSVSSAQAHAGSLTQTQSISGEASQPGSSGLAQSVSNNKTSSINHTAQRNQTATDVTANGQGLGGYGVSGNGFSEPSSRSMVVGLASSDALSFAPVDSKTGSSAFDKKETTSLMLQTQVQKNLPLQHLGMPRRQGFYLGLVGGPLLTQVKNQGLKKSGFDLGLLAGYTLSKKFSIETGVWYTHQYYYVSGKYYNEFAGINYAASLEGSRNAFEIPLTLKYNFIRRAGGNFFITAGASSFVGVNDKVVIHVAEGTIPPSAHFDYGVTSYLPSYVNISLGYEYKLGKSADIRLEPYFQIPLNSNTGNSFKTESSGGTIQVFNAGIHIGISRFIR